MNRLSSFTLLTDFFIITVFTFALSKKEKTNKKKNIQGVSKLVIQKSSVITSEVEVTL
jgi:hypothetical protein